MFFFWVITPIVCFDFYLYYIAKHSLMLRLIKKMHKKFGISNNHITRLSDSEKKFRYNCLLEEVTEYKESNTIEEDTDALIDIIVFSFGTLERMGLLNKTEKLFKEVMKANLKKEIGNAIKKRNGEEAFKLDLVKPKNWKSPDLLKIINR